MLKGIGEMIIIIIFSIVIFSLILLYKISRKSNDAKQELNEKAERDSCVWQLRKSLEEKESAGWSIAQYCADHGYYTIAIYGMGDIGKKIIDRFAESDVKILYGIDQSAVKYKSLKIMKPTEDLPKVDVIIVTPIYYFWEIRESLEMTRNHIISLEDIIYEME